MSDALRRLLLAYADDELVLGHRHSEWTGFAPHIEEDVAFSSIAQDEIGHAAAYYALAAHLDGGDADALAFGRAAAEYRHALVCERPNGDWAYTIARHWLYDHADDVRLEALSDCADASLRALAAKLRREERYHLLHADAWLARIAHGPVEGRTRLIAALDRALPESMGLFEPVELERRAVEEGWMPTASGELRRRWLERITSALDALGLPSQARPESDRAAEFVASAAGDLIAGDAGGPAVRRPDGFGGRRGRHSADFERLWDVMTSQYRVEPGAAW